MSRRSRSRRGLFVHQKTTKVTTFVLTSCAFDKFLCLERAQEQRQECNVIYGSAQSHSKQIVVGLIFIISKIWPYRGSKIILLLPTDTSITDNLRRTKANSP
eukprot:g69483.t1